MEKIDYSGIEIVRLFLEKYEKMNDLERTVILKTIDILNHPILTTS